MRSFDRPRVVLVDAANTLGAAYGAQQVILAQVEHLRDRVTFEAALPWGTGVFCESLRALGVTVHALPLRDRLPVAEAALESLLAAGEPGLIHTHDLRASAIARPLAQRCGWPVVTTYHENLLLPGLSPTAWLRRWAMVLAERRTARRSQRAIAVSQSIATELAHRLHLAPDRIRVVHNGIDTAHLTQLASAEAVADARRAAQLAEQDRPVVVVGQLVRRKGQHLLLQAAPAILRAEPRVVFVFVGDGPHASDLRAQANAAGLAGRCRWLGYRSPAAAFLAMAEVVALPSLAEGLPIVVLEAMALGRPLVASRAGGTPELIEDSRSGRLVDVGDVPALAGAVQDLLASPEVAAALGRAAHERARAQFSLEGNARQTYDVYEQVLAEARP